VLVYTSTRRVELDRQDAMEAGAVTVTASPIELFAALRRLLDHPGGPPDPPGQLAAGQRRPRRPIRPG
jgi:hypothetical protein